MALLKNAAFVIVTLALTACGNSTEPASTDDTQQDISAANTQANLTSDEREIIRSDDEIKDLASPSQEDDEDRAIRSVYSNLSLDKCERLNTSAESLSKTYKCAGYKDWDLYVRDTEGRFTLSAGQAPDFLVERQPLNTPGNRIEWRLKDGAPHAIIYPLHLQNATTADSEDTLLVVASLPAKGQSGCAQALVKQSSKQKDAARRYADMLNEASTCPNDPAILSDQ